MLPAHVGTSRSMLATLQRDFARLRTLDHPNIARMLELGHNGRQYYVTGERLDGEPLREVLTHLAPERVEIGEADDIVRAIGSALTYAHEHGIAHGDVRAENVMVTMDRRFVLTNFLARRVAKAAARPPRPSDDLKGLARLAAELYTGSTSLEAVRAAAHGTVPAARLNAIRRVLEASSRRQGSVADFLAAAGLAFDAPVATVRHAAPRQPSRSVWRLALPLAAVVAIGTFAASYYAGAGVSADEIKVRGLEALRAVAARVAPAAAPAADDAAPSEPAATVERTAVAEPTAGRGEEPPLESEAAQPPQGAPPAASPEAQPTAASAPNAPTSAEVSEANAEPAEPAVVSLGVPRIAAREDHSVVAIEIVRTGDTAHEAAVGWWTSPDTAHEEDDYAGIGRQTVTFPAGATVERVLIPIVNDGVRESDEVFTVHLSRPRGGVAGAVTATRVTLHDDD